MDQVRKRMSAKQCWGFELNSNLVKTMQQVLDLDDQELVIDARPGPRFNGTVPEVRPGLRSGHMPGAVNVPSSMVIAEDGSMKGKEELYDIFRKRGVDVDGLKKKDKEINVTTLQSSIPRSTSLVDLQG